MQTNNIFSSHLEDFTKIFLATFLVLICMISTNVLNSATFIFLTVYFLDGGHVYSTLLEVVGDPEEIRKKYVWMVLIGTFFLNLFIHLFFTSYFFYYVFYFTVYHNMRQGLGITFLYRLGEKKYTQFIKRSYYFLTMLPFIIFHFKAPLAIGKLGDTILKPLELYNFFPEKSLEAVYHLGLVIYLLGIVCILAMLIYQKNFRGFLSMLFFAIVYAYAFIVSKNEMVSYALLVFSHAIPYYFLMEKRLKITHKLNFMQKYAWLFLLVVFGIGGFLDSYQEEIIALIEPFDSLGIAILTTPLISHFIFDAIIWKSGNERFHTFVSTSYQS